MKKESKKKIIRVGANTAVRRRGKAPKYHGVTVSFSAYGGRSNARTRGSI